MFRTIEISSIYLIPYKKFFHSSLLKEIRFESRYLMSALRVSSIPSCVLQNMLIASVSRSCALVLLVHPSPCCACWATCPLASNRTNLKVRIEHTNTTVHTQDEIKWSLPVCSHGVSLACLCCRHPADLVLLPLHRAPINMACADSAAAC